MEKPPTVLKLVNSMIGKARLWRALTGEGSMPLYEYRCEKCNEEFEVLRRINDEEEVRCPKCDEPAKKLVSGFATISAGGSCAPTSSGGG